MSLSSDAQQIAKLLVSSVWPGADWEARVGSLPRYFFGVYYQGDAEQCAAASAGSVLHPCCLPAVALVVASKQSWLSKAAKLASAAQVHRMHISSSHDHRQWHFQPGLPAGPVHRVVQACFEDHQQVPAHTTAISTQGCSMFMQQHEPHDASAAALPVVPCPLQPSA